MTTEKEYLARRKISVILMRAGFVLIVAGMIVAVIGLIA